MATLPSIARIARPRAERGATSPGDYRLFWRRRASSPWRREEFASREEAFNRFFYLLERGAELRWRTLQPPR